MSYVQRKNVVFSQDLGTKKILFQNYMVYNINYFMFVSKLRE